MNIKFNSAYIGAVGAVIALSASIMYSCSSDDDYDLYQGDELKTYAAVTRAGSESSGGNDGIKVYTYSFRESGSRTAIESISEAKGFTASVTFSWEGTSYDAKTEQINVSCSLSNPTNWYKTTNGNTVVRQLYTNTDYRTTAVLPYIGDANTYSSLTTELTVEYDEMSYDSYGNRTSCVRRTHGASVTVDITDCIEAKYRIIK